MPDDAKVGNELIGNVRFTLLFSLLTLILLNYHVGRYDRELLFHLEAAGYYVIRVCLPDSEEQSQNGGTTCPVVVIDIGEIGLINPVKNKEGQSVPGRERLITNREPLRAFLRSLDVNQVEEPPAAIGFDIDFASNGGLPNPEDFEFFDECLRWQDDWRQKRPGDREPKIFLAVYEPQGELPLPPKKEWSKLAAFMGINDADTGRLEGPVVEKNNPNVPPGLGYALANAFRPLDSSKRVISLIFHQDTNDEKTVRDSYLVDFSWRSVFSHEPLSAYGSPEALKRLQGKIVLLGDMGKKTTISDAFVVPGELTPVPGVYVHACGAATLSGGHPLYLLKPWIRESFDVLAALFVVFLMAYSERSVAARVSRGEVIIWAFLLTTIASFIFGIVLCRLRIFWPDLVVIVPILILHPFAHRLWEGLNHLAHHLWEKTCTVASRLESRKSLGE